MNIYLIDVLIKYTIPRISGDTEEDQQHLAESSLY